VPMPALDERLPELS